MKRLLIHRGENPNISVVIDKITHLESISGYSCFICLLGGACIQVPFSMEYIEGQIDALMKEG